jgi:bifunctional polynucleotide phosphatase/kinase
MQMHHEYIFPAHKREVVLVMGCHCSGKSEFIRKTLLPLGYKILQVGDPLKPTGLAVVEGPFPDTVSRRKVILWTSRSNFPIICIHLTTPMEVAQHLDNTRHLYSHGKINKVLPRVYRSYHKKYEQPDVTEGFRSVEHVDFNFDDSKLKNPRWYQYFRLYVEHILPK